MAYCRPSYNSSRYPMNIWMERGTNHDIEVKLEDQENNAKDQDLSYQMCHQVVSSIEIVYQDYCQL
jgi:hypothetical protein